MQSGQIQLAELINKIQECKEVTYRLVLKQMGETYHLYQGIVDMPNLVPDPGWSVADYGRYVFLAGKMPGEVFCQWIHSRSAQTNDFVFQIPEMQDAVNWTWFPSHTRYAGITTMMLPHSRYELNSTPSYAGRENNSGFLIGDDCPSFPNFDVAAFRLLYDAEWQPGQSLPSTLWLIRITHTEAWIDHLKLSPSSLSVTVAGTNVEDSRLEVISSGGDRFTQKLKATGIIECPFPTGLPSRLTLILSRKRSCLDYRDIDMQGSPARTWNNIVVDQPATTSEQIQGLIYQGEGETIEFKDRIPDDKDKFLKTVAAFANGQGGVILIGVDDENGRIVGFTGNIGHEKVRIINMIRASVIPNPEIRLEDCEVNSKNIIAVYVKQGDNTPYGIHPAKPAFYVRRGSISFPASQEEILNLAQLNRNSKRSSYNQFLGTNY